MFTTSGLSATMYECAVHSDALHLNCHVFDFSHAFVILYLLVIDTIENILNLNLILNNIQYVAIEMTANLSNFTKVS